MSSKILFSDNYEVVPVDKELPKENKRFACITNTGILIFLNYEQKTNNWLHFDQKGSPTKVLKPTHWLRPKASSVVLSMEEIKAMIGDAFDAGRLFQYTDGTSAEMQSKKNYISNLINPQP